MRFFIFTSCRREFPSIYESVKKIHTILYNFIHIVDETFNMVYFYDTRALHVCNIINK